MSSKSHAQTVGIEKWSNVQINKANLIISLTATEFIFADRRLRNRHIALLFRPEMELVNYSIL